MKNRIRKSRLLACVIALFAVLMASPIGYAQTVTVSGTVTDANGDALIGATVSLKQDQKIGTATDIDGHFKLSNVPSNGTLMFSYVGFNGTEEAINGRTTINVVLHEDSELLDEVVVVWLPSASSPAAKAARAASK